MKSVEIDLTVFVLVVFFIFWAQDGWSRVDCALGETLACAAIHAEYVKASEKKGQ